MRTNESMSTIIGASKGSDKNEINNVSKSNIKNY